MKSIFIPEHVTIIDSVITIKPGKASNSLGFADYTNETILIDPSVSESIEQEVFYHELVHWILFKMHNKLEGDEKFVGLFGSLLNQAMKTVMEKALDKC